MNQSGKPQPPFLTDWAMFGGVCGILLMSYFKWIVDHSQEILDGALFF